MEPEGLPWNEYMAITSRFGFGTMTETPLEPSLIPYAGEERSQARTQFGFAVGPERNRDWTGTGSTKIPLHPRLGSATKPLLAPSINPFPRTELIQKRTHTWTKYGAVKPGNSTVSHTGHAFPFLPA